jgi:hypothetical protein
LVDSERLQAAWRPLATGRNASLVLNFDHLKGLTAWLQARKIRVISNKINILEGFADLFGGGCAI